MRTVADVLRERLQKALETHGAIAQFIRKTGFSRGAVENWRDGLQSPTVDKLDKIAAALDTTPTALLRDDSISDLRREILDRVARADESQLETIRAIIIGVVDPQQALLKLKKKPKSDAS